MSTDRELLELAAKAAGVAGAWDPFRNEFRKYLDLRQVFLGEAWRPDEDDGDALRLAVKLGMALHVYPDHHQGAQVVAIVHRRSVESRQHAEDNADDIQAAARRAIVSAAAEIGKAMP